MPSAAINVVMHPGRCVKYVKPWHRGVLINKRVFLSYDIVYLVLQLYIHSYWSLIYKLEKIAYYLAPLYLQITACPSKWLLGWPSLTSLPRKTAIYLEAYLGLDICARADNKGHTKPKYKGLLVYYLNWYNLILIQAWISNYIHYEVWNEIIYPFLNFDCATVEVWEWINNIIPHFTGHVITYPC